MNILIQIAVLFCAVKTFSFANWCRKYEEKMTGAISVYFLGFLLLLVCFIIYRKVN